MPQEKPERADMRSELQVAVCRWTDWRGARESRRRFSSWEKWVVPLTQNTPFSSVVSENCVSSSSLVEIIEVDVCSFGQNCCLPTEGRTPEYWQEGQNKQAFFSIYASRFISFPMKCPNNSCIMRAHIDLFGLIWIWVTSPIINPQNDGLDPVSSGGSQKPAAFWMSLNFPLPEARDCGLSDWNRFISFLFLHLLDRAGRWGDEERAVCCSRAAGPDKSSRACNPPPFSSVWKATSRGCRWYLDSTNFPQK